MRESGKIAAKALKNVISTVKVGITLKELDKIAEIPDIIFAHNLLKPGGLFVLEHSAKNNFTNHPNFVDHRNYGNVNFSLFEMK